MKTPILYIDNKYCTSVDDIKDVLSRVDGLESPLFHELRRTFQDGTLSAWLSDGSEYEKELVHKLNELSPAVTNEVMLQQFNKLFAHRDVTIKKPRYTDYFKLLSSRYMFNLEENASFRDLRANNFLSVKGGDILLEFNFEIIKPANLEYTITVELADINGTVVAKKSNVLNLKSVDKLYSYDTFLDISAIDNQGLLSVYVDSVKIAAHYLLNRPIPVFSKSCSALQKKAINKLLDQMQYVAETTDYFNIFDGGKYMVTLTEYFISPLVSDSLYNAIANSIDSGGDEPYYTIIDCVQRFVDRLNSLSNIKFSLPSEAQWINAVNKKAIESSKYEWLLDRQQGQQTSFRARINPVCESESPYHVIRQNTGEREYAFWGFNYFRLVLMS